METPKPPASSQLRRPSTSPYVRRKRATTVRGEAEAELDGSAPATELAATELPSTELAVAEAVAAAVNTAVNTALAAMTSPAPAAAPAKKAPKTRSRAKTQPATPIALAAAIAEPAPTSEAPPAPAISSSISSPISSSIASSIARPAAAQLHPQLDAQIHPQMDAQIHAQIDASLDVLEGLLDSIEASTAEVSFSPSISLSTSPSTSPSTTSSLTTPLLPHLPEPPALTELPSPRQLPTGGPADPAAPPGLVPRGDSRSLRRGELFALVYRVHCFVVTRHGHVGQQGHWSAVEYPTPSAASHAYARGCSHWASEGFSDYRG